MDRRLEEIFERFKKINIAVIGDIIYDKFVWGEAKRISPEAPVPVVDILETEENLGGAGNVTNNIVSLGGKCDLYGVLGNDSNGEKIKELCDKKGIGLIASSDEWPTILKERIMAYSSSDRTRAQQLARTDYGEFYLDNEIKKQVPKIGKEVENALLSLLEEKIGEYDYVVLSDYDKRIFTKSFASRVVHLARLNNTPVLADPKPANAEFFYGCNVICPNREEAEKISGISLDHNLLDICRELNKKVGTDYIVITLDKDGACSYHNGKINKVPTLVVGTADVAGAGDTFAATLALSLSAGENIHDSVKLANAASGVVVEKRGVQTASPKEIKEYFARYRD